MPWDSILTTFNVGMFFLGFAFVGFILYKFVAYAKQNAEYEDTIKIMQRIINNQEKTIRDMGAVRDVQEQTLSELTAKNDAMEEHIQSLIQDIVKENNKTPLSSSFKTVIEKLKGLANVN